MARLSGVVIPDLNKKVEEETVIIPDLNVKVEEETKRKKEKLVQSKVIKKTRSPSPPPIRMIQTISDIKGWNLCFATRKILERSDIATNQYRCWEINTRLNIFPC